MEVGFGIILDVVLGYVLSPHVWLIHFVSFGLMYSLIYQGIVGGWKDLFHSLVLRELVLFIAWMMMPEVMTTIGYIYISLRFYEDAIGDRQLVVDDRPFVLQSDFQLFEYIQKMAPMLQMTGISNADGQFCLTTGLQFLTNSKQVDAVNGGCLNVEDVSHVDLVSSLKDKRVTRSLHRLNIQDSHCLLVKTQSHDKMTILIADSKESCEQWYRVFAMLTGEQETNSEKECLKMMVQVCDDVNTKFGIEDCIKLVQKSGRKVDEKYMYYVIQSLLPQERSNLIGNELFGKLQEITSSKNVSDKNKKKAWNACLNWDQFMEFSRQLVVTEEVEVVFKTLLNKKNPYGKSFLSLTQFLTFLHNEQKDDVKKGEIQNWISQNEPHLSFYKLSCSGFSRYFFSEDNTIINAKHQTVYQDMTQPLSHYFIATSHNTYLLGDQLKGKSSVEAYINAFKRGCKCVELDCWDGPNMEPIIYHGHTLTTKILFKDVIQAVKDYAFCVSQYPVILSFENHCSVEQQKVMAQHLKTILGDLLYTKSISEDESMLPSPTDLSGYVIVKAKKLKTKMSVDEEIIEDEDYVSDDESSDDELNEKSIEDLIKQRNIDDNMADLISISSLEVEDEEEEGDGEVEISSADKLKQNKMSLLRNMMNKMDSFTKSKKGDEKPKVPKLAKELSDLVVYCQATGFKSFEHSRLNAKHYEMSSFGEKKATKFCQEEGVSFLKYNQRQLSRIYPAGARIDSSNYNPVPLWNVGCQLVALNYQTPCRELHLNQGLFQDNGGCGYVLKPEFMRKENITFDPRETLSSFQRLSIRIIGGHQLPYKQEKYLRSERNYQVYVRIEGVEHDVQCQKTNPIRSNGFNPKWNEVLVFKVHVPDLALVTFAVCTKTLNSQQTVRYQSLKQGFRRVPLTDKHSKLLPNSYLFVHIDMTL